jgi:hypothetical protein
MTVWLILGLMTSLQQDPELPAPFSDFHIEARTDFWFASFEGSGKLNNWFGNERDNEKKAPRLSFDREGRLGATEIVPGAEVQFLWENSKHQYRGFGIGFRQGEWSESGSVDQDLTIDGTLVPAGSPFRSKMVKYTAQGHYVGGFRPEQAPIDLRGWIGCLFHQERFRMDTSSGALKDGAGGLNFDFGGRVEARPLPFLFAAGELSGSIGFGTPEARASVSAGVVWNDIWLEGGYRHLWTGWSIDPIFRMSIGGPFVGAAVRF